MWEIEKGIRGLDGLLDMLDEVETIKTRKKFNEEPIEYLEQYCGYDTECTSWRENPDTGAVYPQSHFIGISRAERDELHATTVARACTYIWMLSVKGKACHVRSWSDCLKMFQTLVDFYKLTPNRRLKIPVQNLSYEFQFMKDWFKWLQVQDTKFNPETRKREPIFDDGGKVVFYKTDKPIMKSEVFSTKDRNVIRAVTADGIEFIDTLILSKANLEHMADNLRDSLDWFNLEKLVNDMDYTKLRFPDTELTEKELEYCANDVKILSAYFWNKAQEDGDLTKIPMTDTGYVRAYTRKKALVLDEPVERVSREGKKYKDARNHDFIREIHGMNMTVETYRLAKEVFRGGHTHANAHHVGKILKDVASNDFTSSYPTQMISKPYPSSTPVRCDKIKSIEDVKRWSAAGYFVMFRVKIWGLEEKFTGEHILSESKCKIPKGQVVIADNGRLVTCPYLETAFCDIDMRTFGEFYKWTKDVVFDAYVSRYAYLPKPIVESILHFYANKCLLKGSEDPDEIIEFMKSKGMLNSSYGMQVMDIVRQYVKYTDDWNISNVNERSDEDMWLDLTEYNTNTQRFTFFLQGVACTAWSRDALLGGILAIGPDDYVYADTDSIKHMNHEKHVPYFEAYNKMITEQVNKVLDFYGIDRALACPVVDKKQKDGTIKKVAQPIGVWDYEGTYKAFMTWGAKRYLVIKWDKDEGKWKPEATVAGVNKRKYTEYLATCGKNPFKVFHPGKLVPHSACQRLTSQYIDAKRVNGKKVGYRGTVTDCNGKVCDYFEYSFVYMEPSDYLMSLGEFGEYLEALNH